MWSGGRGSRALSGARAWAAARSYREYAVGLLLLVLLGSGAFGGLAEAGTDEPRAAAAGEALDATPFRITVERVRTGTDLGVASVPEPEGRYLLVSARISVDADASVPLTNLRDLVRLEGANGLIGPLFRPGDEVPARAGDVVPSYLLSSEDAEPLGDIAPGLTYPSVFLFQQVASEPVPDEVTVVLATHTRRKSSIDQVEGWFDPAPAFRVTLPVTEFEAAAEEEQ